MNAGDVDGNKHPVLLRRHLSSLRTAVMDRQLAVGDANATE
jgi:hypothetical protein